jgi:hypothetical protein
MNKKIKAIIEDSETREVGYYYFDRERYTELLIESAVNEIERIKIKLAEEAESNYDDGFIDGLTRAQSVIQEFLK